MSLTKLLFPPPPPPTGQCTSGAYFLPYQLEMVNYLLSQNLGRTLFRPFPPPPTLLLFLVSIECLPSFWVGWLNEKRKKNLNTSEKRRPETTAPLPWRRK